jgi:hypothetical protein
MHVLALLEIVAMLALIIRAFPTDVDYRTIDRVNRFDVYGPSIRCWDRRSQTSPERHLY